MCGCCKIREKRKKAGGVEIVKKVLGSVLRWGLVLRRPCRERGGEGRAFAALGHLSKSSVGVGKSHLLLYPPSRRPDFTCGKRGLSGVRVSLLEPKSSKLQGGYLGPGCIPHLADGLPQGSKGPEADKHAAHFRQARELDRWMSDMVPPPPRVL